MKKIKLLFLLLVGMTIDLNAFINDECATMKPNNYTDKCRIGFEGREYGSGLLSILSHENTASWQHRYKTKEVEIEFDKECNRTAPDSKHRDYYIRSCREVLFSFRRDMRKYH